MTSRPRSATCPSVEASWIERNAVVCSRRKSASAASSITASVIGTRPVICSSPPPIENAAVNENTMIPAK